MKRFPFSSVVVIAFVVACAAMFALAGCSGKGETPAPDPDPSIEVVDGEGAVEVALDYNAGTGFEWECTLEPEGVLMMADQWTEDMADDELIAGGPLRDYVLLRAVAPGTATLTCTLARSWEDGEHAETQTYVFEVDDNLQIVFLDDESDYVNEPERVYNS